MTNITLFGQIIQSLDRSIFNKLVKTLFSIYSILYLEVSLLFLYKFTKI